MGDDIYLDDEEDSMPALADGIFDDEGYDSDEYYGLSRVDVPMDHPDDDLQYLPPQDQRDIVSMTSTTNWNDRLISTPGVGTSFTLDSSRKEAWTNYKNEVGDLKTSLYHLLVEMKIIDPSVPRDGFQPSFKDLTMLIFGPKSEMSMLLCKELGIERHNLAQFLGNLFLQMSYKESPASLYDPLSSIKNDVLMSKDEYMATWKLIAMKKRVDPTSDKAYIPTNRREECIWEVMERVVNKTLRNISITQAYGEVNQQASDTVNIALDDDKIWVESSGRNNRDDFGLRKVTHVKDNRKGIIAHSAVSTATNIPLSITFERNGESAIKCFIRIFGQLFPKSTLSDRGDESYPNLDGVINHSDRGYTIKATTFDFLLPAGADFTNTVKRIMPFPFIWGAKVKSDDPRTRLDEKGAATLYVKETTHHERQVTCAAHRTGTNNISALVSTVIHGHTYEGVCLDPKQRILYERAVDPKKDAFGLDLLFKKLAGDNDLVDAHKDEMDIMLQSLKNDKVDVYTLEQGTADWHRARQFSMTSSQSDSAFSKAFVINSTDNDWVRVAQYLHGNDYHNSK